MPHMGGSIAQVLTNQDPVATVRTSFPGMMSTSSVILQTGESQVVLPTACTCQGPEGQRSKHTT